MNLNNELEAAKKAAVEAGKLIMEIYNSPFSIQYKDDYSPLTDADEKANDLIIKHLSQQFSAYSLLSEESKDDKSRLKNEWCWIIDPLDGTKEFVKRNGEFTVNIALAYKQKPVLGVIYIPVTEELYYASLGNGAFYEGNREALKITVSEKTSNPTLVMSRSHGSDQLGRIIDQNRIENVIQAGSSLKGCLIAKGDAEIYYRLGPTMEWDTAAMQCIVEEAGGIFRQIDDSEMLYNRENSLNDKGFYILNKLENKLDIAF